MCLGVKADGVSDLDERVIEQHAGGPAAFGLALQAVAQEVLPLRAQLLRDLRLVAHSHFVHDLEVMLVLVPGPLCLGVQTQVGALRRVNVAFGECLGGQKANRPWLQQLL